MKKGGRGVKMGAVLHGFNEVFVSVNFLGKFFSSVFL